MLLVVNPRDVIHKETYAGIIEHDTDELHILDTDDLTVESKLSSDVTEYLREGLFHIEGLSISLNKMHIYVDYEFGFIDYFGRSGKQYVSCDDGNVVVQKNNTFIINSKLYRVLSIANDDYFHFCLNGEPLFRYSTKSSQAYVRDCGIMYAYKFKEYIIVRQLQSIEYGTHMIDYVHTALIMTQSGDYVGVVPDSRMGALDKPVLKDVVFCTKFAAIQEKRY